MSMGDIGRAHDADLEKRTQKLRDDPDVMEAEGRDKRFSDKSLPDMLMGDVGGVKLDTGKIRFDLLPPDALEAVAQVYTFGAEKYAARNWELGMDWGRVYAAGQRHQHAFWRGENTDQETGYLHTAHMAFAALTLTAFQLRGIGNDSRGPLATPPAVPVTRAVIAIEYRDDRVSMSREDFASLMRESGREL